MYKAFQVLLFLFCFYTPLDEVYAKNITCELRRELFFSLIAFVLETFRK